MVLGWSDRGSLQVGRHQPMADRPFLPDKAGAKVFARIMGIVLLALGVVTLWQRSGRPTGNWSWLTGPIFDVAGNVGIALFYGALGLFLLLVGLRTKE